jgi:transcriptional regulator with XRE-family HTH domain
LARKQKTTTFEERFPARDSPTLATLAENVLRLRGDRGLSQAGLAALIDGVDQRAISLLENSRANPTLLMIEAVAEALEVTVAELLDPAGTGSKKR